MRTKKTIAAAIIASFVMILALCGQVTTKIKVIDEQGQSVEGAEVVLWYVNYTDQIKKVFVTDPDGRIEDKGKPELRINLTIAKEGYYKSSYQKTDGTALDKDQNHELTVTLRKKVNPIPMYAKTTRIRMPRDHEWFGYDLELGDLVYPDGKGRRADFMVKISSLKVNSNGSIANPGAIGRLWIKFPNQHEGVVFEQKSFIKESEMKMPHMAPAFGYQMYPERVAKTFYNESAKTNCGIFMRVRVTEDENGEVKAANYAKIVNDIVFDPRQTGWHTSDQGKSKTYGSILLTYYFNPNVNDRNLEFDPKQNLFNNLSNSERVTQP